MIWHFHRWRLVMIEDSEWPQHYGHTIRCCTICGARRPVDKSRG
jgi:hypothetical protein